MSAPSELILVRHGETEWNLQGRLQGQLDSPLTERGEAQARALGLRLAGHDVARIVTSDLPRALRTARMIAGECAAHVTPETHPGLRERHFGVLQGLRVEELSPGDLRHYERSRDDSDYRVPTGESRTDVWERSVPVLEAIGRANPGRVVLVVTHGGVLSALLRAALGVPRHAARTFRTPNCAFNHLVFEGGALSVRCLGDTSHLDSLAVESSR